MKEKIKNISFWTGLSAGIILLLQAIGNVFGFSINEKYVNDIIMAICSLLMVFGIVNKPKEKTNNNVKNTIEEEKHLEENNNKNNIIKN